MDPFSIRIPDLSGIRIVTVFIFSDFEKRKRNLNEPNYVLVQAENLGTY